MPRLKCNYVVPVPDCPVEDVTVSVVFCLVTGGVLTEVVASGDVVTGVVTVVVVLVDVDAPLTVVVGSV